MQVLTVNEWNQPHTSGLSAVVKSFQIEKFFSYLSVISISFLTILAAYM